MRAEIPVISGQQILPNTGSESRRMRAVFPAECGQCFPQDAGNIARSIRATITIVPVDLKNMIFGYYSKTQRNTILVPYKQTGFIFSYEK